jgi:LacI family transcriptional regulator
MDHKKKTRVTIHDLARQLNTTASTVSRALQGHPRISQAMKDAVIDLATKLNYQPNFIASSLRKGHRNTIGIVIPRIDRNFFASVIGGIEDVSSEAGYNVIICQSHDSEEKEKVIVDTLINGKVDGLLVSLASGTTNIDHFRQTISKGVPLIFFDRTSPLLETSRVEIDDFMGAHMAVSHLIEHGCKRIAHLSGPLNVTIYQNRFKGYKAALEDHDIDFLEELHIQNCITREAGSEATNQLLQLNIDGVFSASDYSALGLMETLINSKIRIPDDIAVVGFANEPYATMIMPTLSSVDQHSREVGQSAARLFLEEIQSPGILGVAKQIMLSPELIIRDSSKKSK